ncbi:damage-control phosphatase ARMT1 [Drosophila eugracilis]|uniref:damage-control phosphatase ARMT1 n=1 Tax=Drosophila eugracilis TaxID=29029 RepID=UPI0007E6FEC1|nr:damage-control phosphatase ARMT1 [Drosophila eugracilis]
MQSQHSSRTDVTDITVPGNQEATIEQMKELRFNEKNLIIYNPPGINDELSARFLHSFAFATFKRRTPGLIRDLITFLRDRETEIVKDFGDYAHFDLKRTMWSLQLLREEIINNDDFQIFRVKAPDTDNWNEFLMGLSEDRRQWFSAVWMHAECYMYRRVWSIFQRSETLVSYDFFGDQKMLSTKNSTLLMRDIVLSTRQLKRSKDNFQCLLKLSAWANRGDLPIAKKGSDKNIFKKITSLDKDLLADESSDVWKDLTEAAEPVYVDIVCDNAGLELFSDLILAEYIIESGLARRVRFHVKAIPWFILDATHKDFHWLLNFISQHEFPEFKSFGRRIRGYLKDRSFILCEKSYFWTSGHAFSQMKRVQPCLYVYISEAALVIFKGDLNYRKLLGDINYKSTEKFSNCLRGFEPTSVCALRLIKSDIYCGLPVCKVEWLTEDNPEWMTTGDKAVIQVAIKHRLSSDIIV